MLETCWNCVELSEFYFVFSTEHGVHTKRKSLYLVVCEMERSHITVQTFAGEMRMGVMRATRRYSAIGQNTQRLTRKLWKQSINAVQVEMDQSVKMVHSI